MSENCLRRADEIVHGERNAAYGEPIANHTTTAELVSTAWRKKYPWFQRIDAEDVCFFNILQKISREMNAAGDDGPVDICGYSANVEIVRKGWSVAEIRKERLKAQPRTANFGDQTSQPIACRVVVHDTNRDEYGAALFECLKCGSTWRQNSHSSCTCNMPIPDDNDLPPHGERVQVRDIEDETDTVLSDEPVFQQTADIPICGPCTYCGDADHWRPDCKKLREDMVNRRGEFATCPFCQSPSHPNGTPCPKRLEEQLQLKSPQPIDMSKLAAQQIG